VNKSLKLKLVPFLLIFLSAFIFSQTREFVEETYDDGMPKIITIFKQSGNSIIITKRTYWYSNGQNKKKAPIKMGCGMGNGLTGINKVSDMRRANSRMANCMAYITGTTTAEKNSNRKYLKMGFATARVHNGTKIAGNKLKVTMWMENDLVNGYSIMKIEL